MTRVDIVAAVRNEQATLPGFVSGIRALALPEGVELGLLFVEDSSDDGTVPLLRRLSAERACVRYYALEKGFGQGPAIAFGLARSTADAAITMDVDGGHPIECIPEMIGRFLAGARVVQCRRRSLSGRPIYRRLGSALFRSTAKALTGVDFDVQNIFYRLVSADVIPVLIGSPRYWPLLRFPLPDAPGEVVVLDVDAQERREDASKYGPGRLAMLAVDGTLALMSAGLFAALVLVAVMFAVLMLVRSWPMALVLAAGIAWGVQRFRSLRCDDALSRMRVLESSAG